MKEMGMLIDTSKCIACRSCQVACKQWHSHPAEKTYCRGNYQNPPDLSPVTWTLVRFSEHTEYEYGGPAKINWLFAKDQCRHCIEPPCMSACPIPGAITKYDNGAVVINSKRCDGCKVCVPACPYQIPRYDWTTGKVAKCIWCIDRITNNLQPLCAKACPTGTLKFGERKDIIAIAEARQKALMDRGYRKANIVGRRRFNVIYIFAHPVERYDVKVASAPTGDGRVRFADNGFRRGLGRLELPLMLAAFPIWLRAKRMGKDGAAKRPTSVDRAEN